MVNQDVFYEESKVLNEKNHLTHKKLSKNFSLAVKKWKNVLLERNNLLPLQSQNLGTFFKSKTYCRSSSAGRAADL